MAYDGYDIVSAFSYNITQMIISNKSITILYAEIWSNRGCENYTAVVNKIQLRNAQF